MTWVRVFVFPRLRRSKKTVGYTKLLVDLYIVALLGVEIATLCFWAHPGVALWCKAIAAFGLIDVLGATCRDLIVASSLHEDDDGPFILVQDPIRWLLLMPLSALQVVICFAILYLSFGAEFEKTPIDNPMMAVYYSLVTFTTLGYGDITPKSSSAIGQFLVSAELVGFITFLAVKLPIAVAITRVRGGGGASS